MDQKLDRRDIYIVAALALASLAILAGTLGDYSLTWDEPAYLTPALEYLDYFRSLAGEREFHWRDLPVLFETKDRHPPLHRLIALPILAAFPGLPRLVAARGATALLGALLPGIVYLWSRRRLSRLASGTGGILLLFMPRYFAHAHLFALDLAIAFWWTLTLWLFYEGRHRWGLYALACGAFLGALLTKFTAVLIPGALLLWIMVCRYLFRGRRALAYDTVIDWVLKLYLMLLIGGAGFFLLWPQFWSEFRYHVLNYVTFQMKHFNAGVYYFGQAYNGDANPPWHYAWVMLFATLTPVHLLLLGAGLWVMARRWADVWTVLVLIASFFPLLLFSSPTIPRYDGVRLFLFALPGLAMVMAAGVERVLEHLKSCCAPGLSWRVQGAAVILLCLFPALSVVRIHPYQITYFNSLVGGVSGAYRRGLPVTYWGEFLDRVYPALNATLEPGDRLYVAGTFITIDYPHTAKGANDPDARLEPGVVLRKIENLDLDNTDPERQFVLIVQRRDALPEIAIEIEARCDPLEEFFLNGAPMARLYRWSP